MINGKITDNSISILDEDGKECKKLTVDSYKRIVSEVCADFTAKFDYATKQIHISDYDEKKFSKPLKSNDCSKIQFHNVALGILELSMDFTCSCVPVVTVQDGESIWTYSPGEIKLKIFAVGKEDNFKF